MKNNTPIIVIFLILVLASIGLLVYNLVKGKGGGGMMDNYSGGGGVASGGSSSGGSSSSSSSSGGGCKIYAGVDAADWNAQLSSGSRGASVAQLQRTLNVWKGYNLCPDGIFGPKTLAALQKATGQSSINLIGLQSRMVV